MLLSSGVYYFYSRRTPRSKAAKSLVFPRWKKNASEALGKASDSVYPHKSANNAGLRFKVGIALGQSIASCPENHDKQWGVVKRRFTTGGITTGFEWITPVTSAFSVGFEAGVSVGKNRARTNVATYYRADSAALQKKTAEANKFFSTIGTSTGSAAALGLSVAAAGAIENGVFRNFVSVMEYLGGENVPIDGNFITFPQSPIGLFDPVGRVVNAAATFANFVENVDVSSLDEIRNLLLTYYPDFASVLRNFYWAGGANLSSANAQLLSLIFSGGDIMAADAALGNAGLAPNFAAFNHTAEAEVQARRLTLLDGMCAEIRKSAENGKPSFGVCPHLAMKFRFQLPVQKAVIYAKTGITYLLGTASFDNGIPEKKFGKVGIIAGGGVEKNFGRYNMGIEIMRTFATSKNIGTIRVMNSNIQEKVKLSKTEASLFFSIDL
jgi:hypothetical protein